MKSILTILTGATLRWSQLFWYMVVIALLTDLPVKLVQGFPTSHSSHGSAPWYVLPLGLLSFALPVFLPAANQCAIISLLMRSPADNDSPWRAMVATTRKYAWTVIKIYIVWGVCLALPFALYFFIFKFQANRVGTAVGLVLFAVFYQFIALKLVMAVPSALAEKRTEGQAVKRSWLATRGWFWIVLGCELFAFAWQQFAFSVLPHDNPKDGPSMLLLLSASVSGIIASYATVVQWYVYVHIRDREALGISSSQDDPK